jgi:hypothetical protein
MKRFHLLALLIAPLLVLSACDSAIDGMHEAREAETRAIDTEMAVIVLPGQSVTLKAGQHYDAGLVGATREGDILTITYRTYPGWCLYETHVHVAENKAGLPQNRQGNPIPGHFAQGESLDCENEASYHFDLYALGLANKEEVAVAAHAVVRGTADECAIVFGIEHGTGDIYGLNPMSNYGEFIFAAGPDANDNWPNALATDLPNKRMYFAYELREVYFLDLAANTKVHAGTLAYKSAAATFVGGKLYYIPHNGPDDLRAVSFNANGTIFSDDLVMANISPASRFFFGDMVNKDGWIYFSARPNADANPAVFARVRLDGTGYQVISNTEPLMQLAFNKDKNVLYGHVTQQHDDMRHFFAIDLVTGLRGPSLGTIDDRQFNDLTEGLGDCRNGQETAWAEGERFVPQGNWGMWFTVRF